MSERDGSDIERLRIWMASSLIDYGSMKKFIIQAAVCRIRLFPTLISKSHHTPMTLRPKNKFFFIVFLTDAVKIWKFETLLKRSLLTSCKLQRGFRTKQQFFYERDQICLPTFLIFLSDEHVLTNMIYGSYTGQSLFYPEKPLKRGRSQE